MTEKTVAITSIEAIEGALGYRFKNRSLLEGALTHPSSTAQRRKAPAPYERLEFLGDRVVGLIVAEFLYHEYKDAPEGVLAKRQAALVKRDSLAAAAAAINLFDHLALAKGEREGGRGQLTILGDAFEALLGALYLDAGFEKSQEIARKLLQPALEAQEDTPRDPKSALQEWAQARKLGVPVYTITAQEGPSHAPSFVVEVAIKGRGTASANGNSKQAAEKAAATLLLKQLDKKL